MEWMDGWREGRKGEGHHHKKSRAPFTVVVEVENAEYDVVLGRYYVEDPNHQWWHAKMGSSVGTRARWTHVFARFGRPSCMVSRCLATKISASELRREVFF